MIWTHLAEVLLSERYGDAPGALGHARQAVEMAERIGTPYPRAQAFCALGAAHLLAGEWDTAAAALEPGLSITRARRIGLQFEPLMLSMLARAHSARGDHALARSTAEESVEAVRAPRREVLGVHIADRARRGPHCERRRGGTRRRPRRPRCRRRAGVGDGAPSAIVPSSTCSAPRWRRRRGTRPDASASCGEGPRDVHVDGCRGPSRPGHAPARRLTAARPT